MNTWSYHFASTKICVNLEIDKQSCTTIKITSNGGAKAKASSFLGIFKKKDAATNGRFAFEKWKRKEVSFWWNKEHSFWMVGACYLSVILYAYLIAHGIDIFLII